MLHLSSFIAYQLKPALLFPNSEIVLCAITKKLAIKVAKPDVITISHNEKWDKFVVACRLMAFP